MCHLAGGSELLQKDLAMLMKCFVHSYAQGTSPHLAESITHRFIYVCQSRMPQGCSFQQESPFPELTTKRVDWGPLAKQNNPAYLCHPCSRHIGEFPMITTSKQMEAAVLSGRFHCLSWLFTRLSVPRYTFRKTLALREPSQSVSDQLNWSWSVLSSHFSLDLCLPYLQICSLLPHTVRGRPLLIYSSFSCEQGNWYPESRPCMRMSQENRTWRVNNHKIPDGWGIGKNHRQFPVLIIPIF